jgi:hypothetical protein
METRDKAAEVKLMFTVPDEDLGQATLLYKEQPAGKPISIAR